MEKVESDVGKKKPDIWTDNVIHEMKCKPPAAYSNQRREIIKEGKIAVRIMKGERERICVSSSLFRSFVFSSY